MGRLQQRSWTAEDGSARSTVEVVAEELGPSLRWATAPFKAGLRAAAYNQGKRIDIPPRSAEHDRARLGRIPPRGVI
jgi:single-stranded DNA-binding protein